MDKATKNAKEMYDKYSKEYLKSMKQKRFANHYLEVPAVTKLFGNLKNKKVLDCGCASGTHSKILLNKGAKVVGMDISEEMIKAAKEKCNSSNASFIVGDIQKMPFEKNSFDLIFYGLCIHYVKDLDTVFKEAYRILKKNGKIILSTNNPALNNHKKLFINDKKYYIHENYFYEGLEEWNMLPDMKMKTYARTFSGLINPIIKSGFKLTQVIEPQPIKAGEKFNKKEYEKTMKIPYFIIIEAIKD